MANMAFKFCVKSYLYCINISDDARKNWITNFATQVVVKFERMICRNENYFGLS